MSALRAALTQYLALRNALGVDLRQAASLLHQFVGFLDEQGADVITTDLALRFAQSSVSAQPCTHAKRLGALRTFAAWMRATDPRTEVPPQGLLPAGRRTPPYIYTDEEIVRLVDEASQLDPLPWALRGTTYATLLGLLAVSGMRVSEALALDISDVDLGEGVLAIRDTKFGKSRFVPVHDSTRQVLAQYAVQRDQRRRRWPSPAFFTGGQGQRLGYSAVRYNFTRISERAGIPARTSGARMGRRPRLHDLRHRFVVAALVRWYREGRDVEREMPKLSTYVGHVHVSSTYWYVESTPELLQFATERLVSRRREATS